MILRITGNRCNERIASLIQLAPMSAIVYSEYAYNSALEGKMVPLHRLVTAIKGVFTTEIAHAHCDIPCGIYDPHLAQISALTIVRMNQLIEGLSTPSSDASAEDRAAYVASLERYVAVKEEHAELCKRELRILWGDYFKPEHLEKIPDLHDQFWNAMRQASAARQKNDSTAAQNLLSAVQSIAEAFWATKGASTNRLPSRQGAAGGELVYPA
jgi:nickel superoxide dismutase